ncbi:hypothetical protein [Pseudonocardia oroxyli]|uniref:Uncharacterized protein n=1 Tax=Pseudonocardia oroxyli TaxID=366584 RepID=A0A1G7IK08_PSEOR|nr:hypothetical protein [Pseudonocardia oroxyli]SDF13080.1 hypothetical protein SAMN05216377_103329 [Pseudonocardia oroxyli]
MPSRAGTAGAPGPLRSAAHEVLRRPEVLAAALVDVESGLALDVALSEGLRLDPEIDPDAVAAAQVEVLRSTADLARVLGRSTAEVVVRQGEAVFHLVRPLPDPVGGGVAVAVLVAAPERNLRRVRRLLDRIDPRALVPSGPPVRPAPPRPVVDPPAVAVPTPVPAPRTPEPGEPSPGGHTVPIPVTAPFAVVRAPAGPERTIRPTRVSEVGDSRGGSGGLAGTHSGDRHEPGPAPEPEAASAASDWFDPVVPGEPPPLRRTLRTRPDTDHLVLRRRS